MSVEGGQPAAITEEMTWWQANPLGITGKVGRNLHRKICKPNVQNPLATPEYREIRIRVLTPSRLSWLVFRTVWSMMTMFSEVISTYSATPFDEDDRRTLEGGILQIEFTRFHENPHYVQEALNFMYCVRYANGDDTFLGELPPSTLMVILKMALLLRATQLLSVLFDRPIAMPTQMYRRDDELFNLHEISNCLTLTDDLLPIANVQHLCRNISGHIIKHLPEIVNYNMEFLDTTTVERILRSNFFAGTEMAYSEAKMREENQVVDVDRGESSVNVHGNPDEVREERRKILGPQLNSLIPMMNLSSEEITANQNILLASETFSSQSIN